MSLLDGVDDLVLDADMGSVDATLAAADGSASGTVRFVEETCERVMDENERHATNLITASGHLSVADCVTAIGRAADNDDTLTYGGRTYVIARAFTRAGLMIEVQLDFEVKKQAYAEGRDRLVRGR